MKRAFPTGEGLAENLEELGTILQESYNASYKVSSLKPRRRYRKMLTALEAEAKRCEHAPALAEKTHARTGLHH